MEEKEIFGEEVGALTSSGNGPSGEGGDVDLLEEDEDTDEPDLKPLVSLLAKSYGQGDVELPSGKSAAREEVLEAMAEAIEETAEEVQASVKASKSLQGPIRSLDESLKKAKAAAAGYREVRNDSGFNHGKYKYLASKLRTQVAAIDKAIEQHETE
jgi:hypothetical protein